MPFTARFHDACFFWPSPFLLQPPGSRRYRPFRSSRTESKVNFHVNHASVDLTGVFEKWSSA